jgi:SAM-dependent methyltransferase
VPADTPLPRDSDWLAPFLPVLGERGNRIVELGCGPGMDARTLADAGLEVVALDRAPLATARRIAPHARLLRADLCRLPFRDSAFDAAVSSLALHYLPWEATRAAFAGVRRLLRPGAPFVFRVNATDDDNHGAGEGEELEPNFYANARSPHTGHKRFFDEPAIHAALAGSFEVEELRHVTTHRYELPKRAWECLARAAEQ